MYIHRFFINRFSLLVSIQLKYVPGKHASNYFGNSKYMNVVLCNYMGQETIFI